MQIHTLLLFHWVFLYVAVQGQGTLDLELVENSPVVYGDHITWPHSAIVFDHPTGEDYGDNTGSYVAADCLWEQRFYNKEKGRVLLLYKRWFNEEDSKTQWVIASSAAACKPLDEKIEIFAVMDGGDHQSDPAQGWVLYKTTAFGHYAVRLGGGLFELISSNFHGNPLYFNSASDEYLAWWPEFACWTIQPGWRLELGTDRWNYRHHSDGAEITTPWSEFGPGEFVTPRSAQSYVDALIADGPFQICSVWKEGYCLVIRDGMSDTSDHSDVELFRAPLEWEESTSWEGAQWLAAQSGRGGYDIQSAALRPGSLLNTYSYNYQAQPGSHQQFQVGAAIPPTIIFGPRVRRVDWVITPIRTGIASAVFSIAAHSTTSPIVADQGLYLTAGDAPGQVFTTDTYDPARSLWTLVPLAWSE